MDPVPGGQDDEALSDFADDDSLLAGSDSCSEASEASQASSLLDSDDVEAEEADGSDEEDTGTTGEDQGTGAIGRNAAARARGQAVAAAGVATWERVAGAAADSHCVAPTIAGGGCAVDLQRTQPLHCYCPERAAQPTAGGQAGAAATAVTAAAATAAVFLHTAQSPTVAVGKSVFNFKGSGRRGVVKLFEKRDGKETAVLSYTGGRYATRSVRTCDLLVCPLGGALSLQRPPLLGLQLPQQAVVIVGGQHTGRVGVTSSDVGEQKVKVSLIDSQTGELDSRPVMTYYKYLHALSSAELAARCVSTAQRDVLAAYARPDSADAAKRAGPLDEPASLGSGDAIPQDLGALAPTDAAVPVTPVSQAEPVGELEHYEVPRAHLAGFLLRKQLQQNVDYNFHGHHGRGPTREAYQRMAGDYQYPPPKAGSKRLDSCVLACRCGPVRREGAAARATPAAGCPHKLLMYVPARRPDVVVVQERARHRGHTPSPEDRWLRLVPEVVEAIKEATIRHGHSASHVLQRLHVMIPQLAAPYIRAGCVTLEALQTSRRFNPIAADVDAVRKRHSRALSSGKDDAVTTGYLIAAACDRGLVKVVLHYQNTAEAEAQPAEAEAAAATRSVPVEGLGPTAALAEAEATEARPGVSAAAVGQGGQPGESLASAAPEQPLGTVAVLSAICRNATRDAQARACARREALAPAPALAPALAPAPEAQDSMMQRAAGGTQQGDLSAREDVPSVPCIVAQPGVAPAVSAAQPQLDPQPPIGTLSASAGGAVAAGGSGGPGESLVLAHQLQSHLRLWQQRTKLLASLTSGAHGAPALDRGALHLGSLATSQAPNPAAAQPGAPPAEAAPPPQLEPQPPMGPLSASAGVVVVAGGPGANLALAQLLQLKLRLWQQGAQLLAGHASGAHGAPALGGGAVPAGLPLAFVLAPGPAAQPCASAIGVTARPAAAPTAAAAVAPTASAAAVAGGGGEDVGGSVAGVACGALNSNPSHALSHAPPHEHPSRAALAAQIRQFMEEQRVQMQQLLVRAAQLLQPRYPHLLKQQPSAQPGQAPGGPQNPGAPIGPPLGPAAAAAPAGTAPSARHPPGEGGGSAAGPRVQQRYRLTLTTPWMERVLRLYGNKVVLLDASHGLDIYNYPLVFLLVVDHQGCGIPVAFGVLSQPESREEVVSFLRAVEEATGVKLERFLVDRASGEAAEALEGLQRVVVYWCVSRMQQVVEDKMRELSIPMEERDRILRSLDPLIYAGDKAAFDREETAFLERLAATQPAFVEVYKQDWQPHAERWAVYARPFDVTTTTTHHIGRFFQLLEFTLLKRRAFLPLATLLRQLLTRVVPYFIRQVALRERGYAASRQDGASAARRRPRPQRLAGDAEERLAVIDAGQGTVVVRSARRDDSSHLVCLTDGTCTCRDAAVGLVCVHLEAVAKEMGGGAEGARRRALEGGICLASGGGGAMLVSRSDAEAVYRSLTTRPSTRAAALQLMGPSRRRPLRGSRQKAVVSSSAGRALSCSCNLFGCHGLCAHVVSELLHSNSAEAAGGGGSSSSSPGGGLQFSVEDADRVAAGFPGAVAFDRPIARVYPEVADRPEAAALGELLAVGRAEASGLRGLLAGPSRRRGATAAREEAAVPPTAPGVPRQSGNAASLVLAPRRGAAGGEDELPPVESVMELFAAAATSAEHLTRGLLLVTPGERPPAPTDRKARRAGGKRGRGRGGSDSEASCGEDAAGGGGVGPAAPLVGAKKPTKQRKKAGLREAEGG
ncbi:hypothetical protein PLESTB_000221100 [Pleodorina starrii]|uniref:SWIM-type domain-containing protein n=1 Tax=Pleodorina starrii TaxID=330485 RepID=A0A9W6EYU9_9CHLO|nr:hypothetical protein PLESTM_001546900 [Pleodorina starrii]GLC49456.1 hypothetical protein PLESTB_000221100 [Pleodorina starrii]GLC75690.1 hypothetical protein PLESTF_001674200 [Pleodorina starrii]